MGMPSAALFALRPDLRPKLKRPLRVLAIDPGNTHSAYVVYDAEEEEIVSKAKLPNADMREVMRVSSFDRRITDCAIEMIACYGFPVGESVFMTCVEIGRLTSIWKRKTEPELVKRKTIVGHVCGKANKGDSDVRRAMIERLGVLQTATVRGDEWAALALAVTVADRIVREGPAK